MTTVTLRPATRRQRVLLPAARPITPADPQYAMAWHRCHDTYERAGRR
jgi:hypothetical protein